MTLTKKLTYSSCVTILASTVVAICISCGKSCHEDKKSTEPSFDISDRISNNNVKDIVEDSYGQIWIGTFRGLNKYDGTRYHQYFCVGDSTGLPESNISCLYHDSKGRLWVGTSYGVAIHDKCDGFFRVSMPLKNRYVSKFIEDSKGNIFFFNGYEIYQYDEARNTIKLCISKLDPHGTFTSNAFIDDLDVIWVYTPLRLRAFRASDFKETANILIANYYPMFSDISDKSHIWLYGNDGLHLFDTHSRKYAELPVNLQHLPFKNGEVRCIHYYNKTQLLISAENHGLHCYDFKTGQLTGENDKAFPLGNIGISVNKMFSDSRGNLWLGSDDQGIRVLYKHKDMFNAQNVMRRAIGTQSVKSMAADSHDNVWMATKHNGLCLFDNSTQQLHSVKVNGADTELAQGKVSHVTVDKDGFVWVSSMSNVAKCTYSRGCLTAEHTYKISLPMEMACDGDGNMWVSTAGIYVYRIMRGTGEITQKQVYPKSFVFVPSITQLNSSQMLISAFNKAPMLIDRNTMEASEMSNLQACLDSCALHYSFIPTKVMRDSNGDLWIGTVSNGLLHYTVANSHMERIAGLSCSDVSSIELDGKGNLWTSTMDGLDKYNPSTGEVTCYNVADGTGGFQFYDRSSCHLSDGTLIFGGTHGITAFNPEKVVPVKDVNLLFQNLRIHNQIIHPQPGSCLEESMETAKRIRLNYKQNSFSISFSAVDYNDYKRIHYLYIMEGFDSQWTDAGSNSEVYYSNLPSGHYTFRAKIVSNDSNRVLAERNIKVSVAPMPWNTWWAYLLYIIVVTSLVWFVIRTRNKILRERHLARKAEEDKEQEQRINKMNMSFFANISHEFRTPLTMISGPVEQLRNNEFSSPHDKQLLVIIDRSVKRMLRLVNQLLDFNKLENDTLRLHVCRTDVITEMRRIMDLFLMNAEEKGISIECHGMEGPLLLWLDADKLEKIVNNLMSNAMKHTPHGGRIDVTVDIITAHNGKQTLQITVADTGKGLPPSELDNIFKRYYQLNNQQEGTINWGTGIGLYYARALAELHHGSLKAANRADAVARQVLNSCSADADIQHGAVFILSLPTDDNAYSEEEKIKEDEKQTASFPLDIQMKPIIADSLSGEASDDNRPKVLIVDDDTEVVHYLRTLLTPFYRVIYRFDAESALKATCDEEPSLILCDVVMPGMSGYELCHEVKQDIRLSHIPVVLVTAKTTAEDQVAGLESGADAYIMKPFVPKVLLATVSSLLTNREKVKAILNNATVADKSVEEVLSPQDKAFMESLYRIMEQEMAKSELDVNCVSQLMLMSRSKLYYKVKGLTGENPSVFFKTFKLNRAATLIKEGKYNISEIAYMTGFNTLSHFSTSFKKQFGYTPSEYRKKTY